MQVESSPGAKWELPPGFSVLVSWLRLSRSHGLRAAQLRSAPTRIGSHVYSSVHTHLLVRTLTTLLSVLAHLQLKCWVLSCQYINKFKETSQEFWYTRKNEKLTFQEGIKLIWLV